MYEDAREMHRTSILVGKCWKVGRIDKQRKCSGHAKQRMGPKLMNCCRPEHVATKEYGEMLKIIQVLEDGRVLAKEAQIVKLKDKKGE